MRTQTQVATALDGVEVDCTHCGVAMTMQHTAGSRVRYFHCPSCHRWVSSTYTEIFKGDSKLRPVPRRPEGARSFSFDGVRNRLESWLSALEDQNPYRLLGVSPSDSTERVRDRYRELARAAHPDRGGSQERMQALNAAYEKVLAHREGQRRDGLVPAHATPGG